MDLEFGLSAMVSVIVTGVLVPYSYTSGISGCQEMK
jgi:hypothetical protein